MARRDHELIARLTMNGQQFSADSNRIFADMEARARNTLALTERHFQSSFSNIQKIASKALTQSVDGGALNLDVRGAQEAAMAADAQAAALRKLAIAAEAVALKQQDTSESTRIYLQAARAAAMEAEGGARSAHMHAKSLDLLQAELNQTATGTDLLMQKNRQLNATARGSGMAMMQASQQFQDFFIQVQGGQSVLVAFSQQAGQLAFVLQNVDGIAGKFGRFLAGGWGTLVMAGLATLSLFGDKLFDTGDALEKETRELEKNAEKTRLMDAAKRAYGNTIPGRIAEIRKETEALEAQNRSIEDNLRLQRDRLSRTRETLKSDQSNIALNLLKARQDLSDAEAALAAQQRAALRPNQAGETAALRLPEMAGRVEALRKRVADLQQGLGGVADAIGAAERGLRQIEIQESDARVEERFSAEAKAAGDLRRELDRLKKAREDNLISEEKYETDSLAAKRRHEEKMERLRAREKAANAAEKAEQRVRLLDPVTGGRVSSDFGARTPPKRGASSNHAGVDIAVPIGTEVKAGATGFVVRTGTVRGYGKVVVVDYGDKLEATYGHLSEILVKQGQTVAAGQTIAKSGNTGNSTGPHLHYEVRKDGRPINPRDATVRDGAGIKAAEDRARELVEQEKQYQRILAISHQQMSVEAESLRFLGLKVRGLDEQAAVEADIARKTRDHARQMADLTEDQRREQSKMHPMMNATLATFRAQADVFAGLVEKAGDQASLTEDQRKALDDANAAMLVQLEAARAIAETLEDQYQLDVAISRVRGRVDTASAKGKDRARDDARALAELRKEREDIDRESEERQRDQIWSLANLYRDAFRNGTGSIVENFKDEMLDVISEVAARWTIALLTTGKTPGLSSILGEMGASSGGGGGLLGALGLLGGKSKNTGMSSLLPGAGDAAAAAAGKGGLLGGFGSALSSALPYAAIAMAVLPMITSLFTSPKWGSAGLSLNGGVVSGAQGVGKGASQIKAATGNAGSVAEGINRLAEQLGATITGIPGVTIGNWDGKARVALTSTSKKLHYNNFNDSVLKDFGEGGEQEAIAFAIQYAFTNAALEGISQASKNIIKAGGDDVAKAIEKALLIEDIPKRLQSKLDPVGYAIDQFNKGWEKTIAALKEGGASAEQMAEAQKLYKIELAETKAAAQEASSDLKIFMKSLNFGSASPYSLRDQERMAYEAFKPFEEAILKGERIDQGKYQESAQQWLDLQRQLFGSTGKFFESMDLVQSLTGKAISDIDNAKPIRTEVDPWVKATADSTQASAELLDQVSRQLTETNALLARLSSGISGDDFISNRNGRAFG